MVFFSSCNSVKYHHELLNYIDIPVQCIHVTFSVFLLILLKSSKANIEFLSLISTVQFICAVVVRGFLLQFS